MNLTRAATLRWKKRALNPVVLAIVAVLAIVVPVYASAQTTCFGNGTTCSSALQILSKSYFSAADVWGSFVAGTDVVLIGEDERNNTMYVFRWMPASNCFGNGSSCGSASQSIGTSGVGVDGGYMQYGSDVYVTIVHGSVSVYKWMSSARCLGNGSSCGSAISSASRPGGTPTGSTRFQVGTDFFLAANFWTYANNATVGSSVNAIYKWMPASSCWGTGTSCGSPLQTISTASDARDNGISGYSIGADGYLAIGEYNGTSHRFFKWQSAQNCFGNGSSCGSPMQTFSIAIFAGFTDFEVYTIGTDTYMTTGAYTSSENKMYKWMPASSCWGNGSVCGTAVRTMGGGRYTWRYFTTPNGNYIVGGGLGGAALFRWRPSQSCFGNNSSCGIALQSFNPGGGLSAYEKVDTFTYGGLTYLALGAYGTSTVQVMTDPPPNTAPNMPSISGPSTGVRNQSLAFTFVGTDPQSPDTIRYQIDWDRSNTVDEYAPATGYIANGTAQTVNHTWTTTGTKNFQVRTQDQYGLYSAWATSSVVISNPPPTVLLTASSDTYSSTGAPVTLTWSSSGATSCTGTNFSVSGTSGTRSVTPSVTTTYTVTCTGTGGSGSDSETVTYVCAPTNICSGNDVVNSCTGSIVQSCSYQCSAGACIAPPPMTFNENAGQGTSGHLQIRPALVPIGTSTRLYWSLSGVDTCSVTENNPTIDDSWAGGASGASGKLSSPIFQQTTYTLQCTGLDASSIQETATVNVTPVFREI